MVALTLTPTSRYNDVLGRGIQARARALTQEVRRARAVSADVAQRTSLELIQRRRPEAPPRLGRNEPSISSVLRWRQVRTGSGTSVGVNLTELNAKVGHWIIQEIGTGQRAVVRVAGRTNPVGRPTTGASYVRTVKPQAGRRIRSSLVWATQGGQWVRPGAGEDQQLYLRSKVTGVPHTSTRSQPGIVIRNEIKPRHFVQQGGQAGFRVYRTSVLAAARRTFRKK